MKERTLGNSASRLRASLVEQQTNGWMARSMLYLSVLRKLLAPGATLPLAGASLPPMHPVPTALWLINVYVREALSRLDETRARVTSIFGDLLKMDSTKKVRFVIRHSVPCTRCNVCFAMRLNVAVSHRSPKSLRAVLLERLPGSPMSATSTGRYSCLSSPQQRGTDLSTWQPD